jgi:hypothetical protein
VTAGEAGVARGRRHLPLTRILHVGHDSQVADLTTLTGRWWDWEVSRWDAAGLTLVADNDLTYHWSVEVSFVGVTWVAIADSFSHPVFRQPTGAELDLVRQVTDDEALPSSPGKPKPAVVRLRCWSLHNTSGSLKGSCTVSSAYRLVERAAQEPGSRTPETTIPVSWRGRPFRGWHERSRGDRVKGEER